MSGADVSGSLTLSRNELLALLRRVFEALYGKSCDYEAMAEQIVWLECHGLGGLDLLRTCLTRLDQEERPVDGILIVPFAEGGSSINVDAGGASLLCIGDLLADLLISRCAEQDRCKIEIADLLEGQAIVPQLSRMARAGCLAAGRITNLDDGTRWYAHVSGSSHLPVLSGWEGARDCGERVSLSMLCSTNEDSLRQAMTALDPNWPEPTISPGELANSYSDSLDKGITVGDLAAFNAIADRVLVEATEESRRGAGE